MEKNSKGLIVDLSEIFQHKAKKEKELEFYKKELEKLQFRMSLVQQEIGLTQVIIDMIEKEKVVDLIELMKNNHDKYPPI